MNTAQSSLPALAAGFYPTQGRATGVAWMLGLGRFGGIAGSFLVAELARRQYGVRRDLHRRGHPWPGRRGGAAGEACGAAGGGGHASRGIGALKHGGALTRPVANASGRLPQAWAEGAGVAAFRGASPAPPVARMLQGCGPHPAVAPAGDRTPARHQTLRPTAAKARGAIEITTVTKRFPVVRSPWMRSTCGSGRAAMSACSAPRAAARPPRCGCWRGTRIRPAATSCWMTCRWSACRRPAAAPR